MSGTNNLGGPRIVDSQSANQHTTANDAANQIDAALTNATTLAVTDTNTLTLTDAQLDGAGHFVISNGSPTPTAAITINLPASSARGVISFLNSTSYAATVQKVSGQSAPAPVVAPGGIIPVYYDGTNARALTAQTLMPLVVAASDEVSPVTTGTAKVTFRMPYSMYVAEVRASLKTAQASGSILTFDINEGGTSILSTKLTIDNTEKTSVSAATPAVISDRLLADDAEMTVDVDQIGDGTAVGAKIALIGYKV